MRRGGLRAAPARSGRSPIGGVASGAGHRSSYLPAEYGWMRAGEGVPGCRDLLRHRDLPLCRPGGSSRPARSSRQGPFAASCSIIQTRFVNRVGASSRLNWSSRRQAGIHLHEIEIGLAFSPHTGFVDPGLHRDDRPGAAYRGGCPVAAAHSRRSHTQRSVCQSFRLFDLGRNEGHTLVPERNAVPGLTLPSTDAERCRKRPRGEVDSQVDRPQAPAT